MSVINTFSSKKLSDEVKKRIELYGKTEALRLEGEAKRNRPWTDRTSNARNSIQGKFEWAGDVATIHLSGNAEYSAYLELANGKKYAILRPTIEIHAAEIWKGYKGLVD